MKPRLLPLIAALLCLCASLSEGAAFPSVVGQVPGRITITLKPGVLPSVAKRAGGIAVRRHDVALFLFCAEQAEGKGNARQQDDYEHSHSEQDEPFRPSRGLGPEPPKG